MYKLQIIPKQGRYTVINLHLISLPTILEALKLEWNRHQQHDKNCTSYEFSSDFKDCLHLWNSVSYAKHVCYHSLSTYSARFTACEHLLKSAQHEVRKELSGQILHTVKDVYKKYKTFRPVCILKTMNLRSCSTLSGFQRSFPVLLSIQNIPIVPSNNNKIWKMP